MSNLGAILYDTFGQDANQQLWVSWKSAQGRPYIFMGSINKIKFACVQTSFSASLPHTCHSSSTSVTWLSLTDIL